MRKDFTNKQIAEALGMKPSTVAYYTNKGFVEPEIENPEGRGTTRRYSRRNLVEFLLILELQRHGMTLPKIREILHQAHHVVPKEQFRYMIGREPKHGEFNIWDGLNIMNDPHLRPEVFIIIYDDDGDLTVKFTVLGKKRTDAELKELSRKDLKNYFKRFGSFSIDMYDHNSALVINVTNLWNRVMSV
ncbi:MerR family transcriptional regulator [Thermodesulfobacteriota bacterium]